jgi:predicted transcriptional regulator
MRTTLRLDEHLMQQAKRLAAETGRTLTAVIEDALRESFARRMSPQPKRKIKLPTFDSGGLMPGVDIDNSASLLDIMEEDDAPF